MTEKRSENPAVSVGSDASLSYSEPDIVVILIQSSFIILLNLISYVLNRLVYCGLLGQILVGIAWGSPGAKWLGANTEEAFMQLGYLGLICLVFEGGLSTSFPALKANLLLSCAVAITGITVPMGLSFILQNLTDATPLQAFAAGAALCSTSLGTTFTVLATSGLAQSRLGIVLSSAAMMDDVVGLVMVQVIANLGGKVSHIHALVIVRPILVSISFVVMLPLTCFLIIKPFTVWLNTYRKANPEGRINRVLSTIRAALLIHISILLSLVISASYAGTSNLFAAYLAGASISWWDTQVPHNATEQISSQWSPRSNPYPSNNIDSSERMPRLVRTSTKMTCSTETSGSTLYDTHFRQPVERIFKPLFFASIGFSVPISRMFSGPILWRGVLYSILMLIGKLVCGIWLLPFDAPLRNLCNFATLTFTMILNIFNKVYAKKGCLGLTVPDVYSRQSRGKPRANVPEPPVILLRSFKTTSTAPIPSQAQANSGLSEQDNTQGSLAHTSSGTAVVESSSAESAELSQTSNTTRPSSDDPADAQPDSPAVAEASEGIQYGPPRDATSSPHISQDPKNPVSLYPAVILGFAMVGRGEIGFLISSVAQTKGIFASTSGSEKADLFMIVTWAIILCTTIGPLAVGLLVKRLRQLSEQSEVAGNRNALGAWGVQSTALG